MLFGVTGGFEANLVLGMQVGVQCCQRRTHVMGRSQVLGEAPTRQGPCGRRQQQRGGPVVCRWGQPRGLPTRSGHIRDTSSDCGFRARSKAHPPQLCQPGGHQCDAAWMGQWPSPVPLLDPGAGRRRPGRRSLPSPTAAWGRARVRSLSHPLPTKRPSSPAVAGWLVEFCFPLDEWPPAPADAKQPCGGLPWQRGSQFSDPCFLASRFKEAVRSRRWRRSS